MPLTIIVGGFYGDEGKGAVNAYITVKDKIDAAVRGQGPQAGHTIYFKGEKHVFRQIPSSIYHPETKLLLSVGALVRPDVVKDEVRKYHAYNVENRLMIDENATAILPEHIEREKALKKSIGSVGTGVGPALSDRVMRRHNILVKNVPELKKYSDNICVRKILYNYLEKGKSVLIEGAHATGLSNFHGHYPYTNAYDNTASALLSQTGIGPKKVDNIILVFKAFVSRVGKGPLKGELVSSEVNKRGWIEHGTVSGRLRRAAPFDFEFAKDSINLNTPTDIALTKIDILFPKAAGVREDTKLPIECRRWIKNIEKELGIPITLIKTGRDIYDIIDLRKK
jgi:adenylosuccinate synthase